MSWLSELLNRLRRKPVKPPVPPPVKPTPSPPAPGPVIGESEALLAAHNEARKKHGLSALTGNAALKGVAQRQSDWQAQRDRIGHDGPNGDSPFERIKKVYRYDYASENVAAGYGMLGTAKEAVQAWLDSTVGHRDNVLSSEFMDFGGGMARAKSGNIYWTGVYATPGGVLTFLEVEGQSLRMSAAGLTGPRYEVG